MIPVYKIIWLIPITLGIVGILRVTSPNTKAGPGAVIIFTGLLGILLLISIGFLIGVEDLFLPDVYNRMCETLAGGKYIK